MVRATFSSNRRYEVVANDVIRVVDRFWEGKKKCSVLRPYLGSHGCFSEFRSGFQSCCRSWFLLSSNRSSSFLRWSDDKLWASEVPYPPWESGFGPDSIPSIMTWAYYFCPSPVNFAFFALIFTWRSPKLTLLFYLPGRCLDRWWTWMG